MDDLYDDFDGDLLYHDDVFYAYDDSAEARDDDAFHDPQVRASVRYQTAASPTAVENILQRIVRFVRLSPAEAARAWVGYEFGFGSAYGYDEEDALCVAVCRDPEITLSHDEVFDIVADLMEDEDFDTDDEAERDQDAAYVLDVLRKVSTIRRR